MNSFSKDEFKVVKLGYIQASKPIDLYVDKFVKKLNRSLKDRKYKVEAIALPSVRDLDRSNNGHIHGALTRSNLVDNSAFPNLKMIATPVARMKYQLNKRKGRDLANLKKKPLLVCIKDDRLCNGMLGKDFKVYGVTSHKAQASMLKADRADLVMRVHIKATGLKEELIVPQLEGIKLEEFNKPFVTSTYTYINNTKYPDVYDALSEAYRALENED